MERASSVARPLPGRRRGTGRRRGLAELSDRRVLTYQRGPDAHHSSHSAPWDSPRAPTTDEETATDEAAPILVDAPEATATRKHRAAKASHKGSTEKRSSRKPATMVGALGESQGALWDE